jgi:secernin
VITTLADRHGQGGGCGHENRKFTYHNLFLVADPTEAYVLETAGCLRQIERVAPRYRLLNGAMASPCMHAGGVAVGSQTTASWVAELTPGGGRHWVTGTAAPCTGLFKPVSVTQPLDVGTSPTDRFHPAALWWRHERLHRRVMRYPEATFPTFAAERDEVEARWLASPPDPADAFRQADEALDRWGIGLPKVRNRRPRFVRRYWAVRDRRAGLTQYGHDGPGGSALPTR